MKTCKECGTQFDATNRRAEYCSDNCRKVFNNRRKGRGADMYDAAMKWRAQRGRDDLSALCTIIDRFLAEDRETGRKTYSDATPYYRR